MELLPIKYEQNIKLLLSRGNGRNTFAYKVLCEIIYNTVSKNSCI